MSALEIKPRGFTLVELAVVLTLISVLAGIVVVRFNWGSNRQAAIHNARRIGNLLRTYREKSMQDGAVFDMKFDSDAGRVSVYAMPFEKNASIENLQPLQTIEIDASLKIGKVTLNAQELQSPAVIVLNPKGILPDLSIEVDGMNDVAVSIKPDPLVNEIEYAEK